MYILPFEIVEKIISYGIINFDLLDELKNNIVQYGWIKEDNGYFWDNILPKTLKQKYLKQKNECELLFEFCNGIYIDWYYINNPSIVVVDQCIFKRSVGYIAKLKQMDIYVDFNKNIFNYNGKLFLLD